MIHDPFSKILGDPQDRHPYDECTFITTDRRQTDRRNGEHVASRGKTRYSTRSGGRCDMRPFRIITVRHKKRNIFADECIRR